MKHWLIGAALLFAPAAASAQTVQVGEGDWSAVPVILPENIMQFRQPTIDRLHKLAGETNCQVPGFRAHAIDLRVPFLIKFGTRGQVERIVLRKLHCPQLEALLGGVVRQMAAGGEWWPTGENEAGWYRSELTLDSR